jgi:hypothetical protein
VGTVLKDGWLFAGTWEYAAPIRQFLIGCSLAIRPGIYKYQKSYRTLLFSSTTFCTHLSSTCSSISSHPWSFLATTRASNSMAGSVEDGGRILGGDVPNPGMWLVLVVEPGLEAD